MSPRAETYLMNGVPYVQFQTAFGICVACGQARPIELPSPGRCSVDDGARRDCLANAGTRGEESRRRERRKRRDGVPGGEARRLALTTARESNCCDRAERRRVWSVHAVPRAAKGLKGGRGVEGNSSAPHIFWSCIRTLESPCRCYSGRGYHHPCRSRTVGERTVNVLDTQLI